MTGSSKVKIVDPKHKVLRFILWLSGFAFDMRSIEVDSNRQPSEIMDSLQQSVDSSCGGPIFMIFSKQKYIGSIGDNKFQICCSQKARNSFIPILYGSIEKTITGSKILARFNISPIVQTFLAIFMLMVVWAAISCHFYSILCMLLGAMLVSRICSLIAESDTEKLIELLDQVT